MEKPGENPGCHPQAGVTPSLSTVVHRLSTGYPRTSSPGLWIVSRVSTRVIPRTFNNLSTPGPPSVDNDTVFPKHPQGYPQGYPQPVDNERVDGLVFSTDATELWTTSGTSWRRPDTRIRPTTPIRRPSFRSGGVWSTAYATAAPVQRCGVRLRCSA
ncbi:hypothetical protein Strop_0002 [Salinispora tropica CNB-440]|uniref:Uncharacterized protein n=1 Tax=Salinispora tropica (strain ATCC BAA-916 / DSM 44818 / JCM 13857 / NBRC 105044 / CNB-440) TaxID=369723 RepID=A4X0T7_SALTO|nr:hypothetical protein Strop_0002 [Salinispora tropica CNB-440]